MFFVQSENITCHWKFFAHCADLRLIIYIKVDDASHE
jgi:hypothetical protein